MGSLSTLRSSEALNQMSPRIVRQFPLLHDDVPLVEVMEEADRRIAARQERAGPLTNLYGYAWGDGPKRCHVVHAPKCGPAHSEDS